MWDSIYSFFAEAKVNQTLLFYFTGQGILSNEDIFLATPELDPTKPYMSGFSLPDLTKWMSESKSKNIIGILDVFYSENDSLPERTRAYDASQKAKAMYRETYRKKMYNEAIAGDKNVALLLSSTPYEKTFDEERISNSLFTRYLLEGLKGVRGKIDTDGTLLPSSIDKNRNVTPESLFDYIYYYVAPGAPYPPQLKSTGWSPLVIVSY
jgi:hypothetical protein